MSALDEHLKKHRKKIIEREEETFRSMLLAYAELEKEWRKSFEKLQKQIEAAQEKGEKISPSWFYREKRLKNLLADVNEQIVRFGGKAAKIIEREQREAVKIAIFQAQENYKFQISDLAEENFASGLNARAVETAVGTIGDGSPLLSYFEETLAPAVAERIKSEVIKAAAIGTDYKTIAKRLMETGDITKYRALATARTEVNRVRREATRELYQENDDIIKKWEWVAAKSSRTCPLCLAMDGKTFPLDEPFPQHINCLCTMIPVLIGLKRRPRTIGQDWFEKQDDSVKESVLGKETFAVYKENNLKLDDFVAFRNDKRFGKSVTRKPLAKILADKNINNVRPVIRGIVGQRHSAARILTKDEIKLIKNEFKSIGGNPKNLLFNEGLQTGYIDGSKYIQICGDILPLEGSTHPRSRMSVKAVLAHEQQHRIFSGTPFKVGDWRDEFRASFLAAKRTKNLTERERYDLMDDAVLRATEAGQRDKIKLTNEMKRILGLPIYD